MSGLNEHRQKKNRVVPLRSGESTATSPIGSIFLALFNFKLANNFGNDDYYGLAPGRYQKDVFGFTHSDPARQYNSHRYKRITSAGLPANHAIDAPIAAKPSRRIKKAIKPN